MTKIDEYVATRIELIKSKYKDTAGALADRCDSLWGSMSDTEKRDAARRYFEETRPLLQAGR